MNATKQNIDNSIFWTGKYQNYSGVDSFSTAETTFTPTKKQILCANQVGLDVSLIDPAFRATVRLTPEAGAKMAAFDACMAATIEPKPATISSQTFTTPIQLSTQVVPTNIVPTITNTPIFTPPTDLEIVNDFPVFTGGGGGAGYAPAPSQEEEMVENAPAPKKEKNIFGIKPMYFFGGLAALALTVAVIK